MCLRHIVSCIFWKSSCQHVYTVSRVHVYATWLEESKVIVLLSSYMEKALYMGEPNYVGCLAMYTWLSPPRFNNRKGGFSPTYCDHGRTRGCIMGLQLISLVNLEECTAKLQSRYDRFFTESHVLVKASCSLRPVKVEPPERVNQITLMIAPLAFKPQVLQWS